MDNGLTSFTNFLSLELIITAIVIGTTTLITGVFLGVSLLSVGTLITMAALLLRGWRQRRLSARLSKIEV